MWDSSSRNASISVSRRRRRNQTEEEEDEDEDESFDCRRVARVYIMMIVISHCTHTHTRTAELATFCCNFELRKNFYVHLNELAAGRSEFSVRARQQLPTGNALSFSRSNIACNWALSRGSTARASPGLALAKRHSKHNTHTHTAHTHTQSRQDKARHFG